MRYSRSLSGSGIVILEGGNQCIPVNYASKETGSASAGR